MHTLMNILANMGWHPSVWTVVLLLAELLALFTVPSVLIQRRGRPQSALAWLLGLIALPFVGVLLWWGIGRTHLMRKRHRRRSARAQISPSLRVVGTRSQPSSSADVLPSLHLPADEALAVFPPVDGNSVKVLVDGAETYPALERIVRGGRHHVHFLFYAWRADEVGRRFRDLLAGCARGGVQVRVLCDAVGSFRLSNRFLEPLRAAGGKVAFFMPTRILRRSLTLNFRNHRKIVVVDGSVGYTGGLNIGAEYTRGWRDLGLLLAGPVVGQLQEIFADDWFFATGENLAAGEFFPEVSAQRDDLLGPEGVHQGAVCRLIAGGPDAQHNATHDTFLIAVNQARRRVLITTPYLTPGPAIQAALRTAVYRGLDVRLLVPRDPDVRFTRLAGRSYYPDLLAGGVRIFEYAPGTLHQKMWVFDDELSAVGSANLDTRSFRLSFEACCFIQSRSVNSALADLFRHDQTLSEEVTPASVEASGRWQQLKEAVANLLSPML
jgi:cardiolipin synthase